MFFITILACKFLLFCIFAAKKSCLTATVRRLQKLGMLLNSAICIRLLPNNSFRLQKYKKNNESKNFIKQKISNRVICCKKHGLTSSL